MSVTYCERIQNIAEVSKKSHPLYQKALLCFDTAHLHDIRISAQVICLSNCGFKKFFFLFIVLWPIHIISLLLSRVNWWVRQKKKKEVPGKNTCNPTQKQNLAECLTSDLSKVVKFNHSAEGSALFIRKDSFDFVT